MPLPTIVINFILLSIRGYFTQKSGYDRLSASIKHFKDLSSAFIQLYRLQQKGVKLRKEKGTKLKGTILQNRLHCVLGNLSLVNTSQSFLELLTRIALC